MGNSLLKIIKLTNGVKVFFALLIITSIPLLGGCTKAVALPEISLEEEPLFYAHADVCGDKNEEDAYLSRASMYVIDRAENKVIYEGCSYEKLLDWNGHKGIIYQRDGGAPTNTIYQYISLDENGEVLTKITWALYDGDENGVFDENDYYEFNGQEVEYAKWQEITAEYMEMAKHTIEWEEIKDADKAK